MKNAMSIVASMIAACALAFDDVQVTYRGRLRENGNAPDAQTVSMRFRLYAKKKDVVPSWTAEIPAVRIDHDGLFQVALRGDGLASVIDEGRANWIGVSIDGGKEQYPRQALLAHPFASAAATAESLARSPYVKTAAVERVEAKSLAVSALSVGGETRLPVSAVAVSVPVDVKLTKGWWTLPVKGKVRLFNGANPRNLGTQTASGGGCSFGYADCNGVALFTSENSDVMPGMSLFIKQGERIELPWGSNLPDGVSVRCRFYKIGVE
jgi:hypothetical protein